MGIYEGLGSINKYKDDLEARKKAAEEGKVNWLKIDDGETVKIWFLQELDKSAENYHEENGLGIMATEHVKPGKDNFQTKALCTIDDEEQCLGCEKHREDWKAGWRQKARLYINVLVERKNGDREVAVMSQANGSRAIIAPMLLDKAVDNNTITDRWWKITRNGEGTDTTYIPNVGDPSNDVDPLDYSDKIVNLREKAVRSVPYEDQFDFFFGSDREKDSAESAPNAEAAGSVSSDEEW